MPRCAVFAAFAVALALAMPARAERIDTTGNPVITGIPFGVPSQNTGFPGVGQIFTVGSDTVLESFSLFLGANASGSNNPLSFRGYLAEWDGFGASTPLFSSDQITFGGSEDSYSEFYFAPGLVLEMGNQYVAYLDILGSDNPDVQRYFMPVVESAIGAAALKATDGSWFTRPFFDVWFVADLTPQAVPEPSTAALLGIALAGLGLVRRRGGA